MLADKNNKDLYQLFSILHQYSSAGVNPADGIALYAGECRPAVRKVLEEVLKDLRSGSDLPTAMEKHPGFFPSFIVEMMKVNDKTGQAASIYESIEETLEQEIDLKRNVQSEILPACFLLVALALAFCIAVFFVIPMMGGMLADIGVELPLLTRFFLGVADLAVNYWYVFLAGGMGALAGLFYIKKRKPEIYARGILHLPFYKGIVYSRIQYRFARIFGLCIEAGIETSRALQYTATAVDNILLRNALENAVESINRSGTDLVTAIKKANGEGIVDTSYYAMLEAGQHGNLEKILENRASYFRKQLLAVSKTFGTKLSMSIITPGFVVLIAIFLSVYMPIFKLMGNVGTRGGMGM